MIDRLCDLAARNALIIFFAMLLLTIMGAAWEYYFPTDYLGIPISILTAIVEYWAVKAALKRENLLAGNLSGVVSSFVFAGILVNLGVLLGLVLLIVPGLYLALRWAPVTAIVFSENPGPPPDVLARAWAMTQGNVKALIGGYALTLIPQIAALGAYTVGGFEDPEVPVPLTVIVFANAMMSLGTVLMWYLGIAIYQELAAPADDAETVFG